MTRALAPLVSTPAPSNPANEEKSLIRQVALNTLVEICAITLITGICSQYAATPEMKAYFIRKGVTAAGINFLARSVAAVARNLKIKPLCSIADYLAPASFALKFHWGTTSSLIHEMGHAAAFFLLTKNIQVQIVAKSIDLWETTPIFGIFSDISSLGKYLGRTHFCFTSLAGGTIAHLIAAQVALIFGLRVKKSYPEFSKYLIISATTSIFTEALDALYPLFGEKPSDFFPLWKEFGIHPIAAAATIVALPTIMTVAYLVLKPKQLKSPAKTE